ncbi:hypothetical protein AM588_10006934 [Phytophthora nicotianae]|uniref:Rad51-like C-terminal domain-containing protein n=1 Tax=Phytophthora nicotianae TaxID=4792 RepID=A0A0W8CW95_PHYNI|nr:hypothetical protein AM588_10006934 [Phytophthora nicotianae]
MAATLRVVDSDDEEHDSLRSYEPIDLLQDAGVKPTDIAKLKNDGFATIGQLFQVSHKRLLDVKGISEAKRVKIMPEKSGFVSASALYQQSQSRIFITTGSQRLDQILGGGVETMSVTEVNTNEALTCKTQLCHTDPVDVLDNIIVARAHSHDAQMAFVIKLGVMFAEFNIAVLLVNQMMADPGANALFGSEMKPVGGHVMSHGVHTRVLVSYSKCQEEQASFQLNKHLRCIVDEERAG